MTSTVHICFEDENKPANFPNYATIIQRYNEEYPRQTTEINISGVRLSLDKSSDNEVSDLWVKAGVRMGEARTQRYVAQHLQNNVIATVRAPHVYLAFTWCGVGYIVSEYIDGKMCDDSDIPRVAAAVQALISIPTPSPSSAPGPVGGGPIEHPFFIDRTSSIRYESVEELQDHVNGILRYTGRKGRVEFGQDIHGLCLCVSDLMLTNFMKDGAGGIAAVDFGGYSFLPHSFFIFTVKDGGPSKLKQHLTIVLENLKSSIADVLVSASRALVPYSSNAVGLPESLKSRLPE